MSGSYVYHRQDKKKNTELLLGKFLKSSHLEDQRDGRLILRWILGRQMVRMKGLRIVVSSSRYWY